MIDSSGHVVVTGGNSGIARGVARAGASVAIWSRRQERNAEAVTELEGLGAAAIGMRCDVSDEDNHADAMRAPLNRCGGPPRPASRSPATSWHGPRPRSAPKCVITTARPSTAC